MVGGVCMPFQKGLQIYTNLELIKIFLQKKSAGTKPADRYQILFFLQINFARRSNQKRLFLQLRPQQHFFVYVYQSVYADTRWPGR